MSDYLMQAASSVDGQLHTWTSATADFAASGYPGDGTATDVAVSVAPAVSTGGGSTPGGSEGDAQKFGTGSTLAPVRRSGGGAPSVGDIQRFGASGAEWSADYVELPDDFEDGDLFYVEDGEFVRIPAGTNGQVLTMVDGVPAWADPGEEVEPFDLASLESNGWWEGPEAFVSSPWAGSESAGSSDSYDLTEGTNPPTAGTAVDGFTPYRFNGTDQKLGHAGPVAPTFVSTTGWSTWVMFKATAAFAFGTDGTRYNSPHFWGSNDSGVGVGFDSNGIFVQQADNSPAQHDTKIACATGAWHVLFAWWDGMLLHLQLDDGTPVTTACTSMYSGVSSGTLFLGTNWSVDTWFQGDIMNVEIRDVPFAGTEAADIYASLKAKYPSASLP